MATYKFEQFLNKEWTEWPTVENELFEVVLRSGDRFEMTTAQMEVSSAFWEFYRQYKQLEARKEHFIVKVPISNGDITAIQSRFTRDIHESYGVGGYCKEEMWKIIDETSERLYNQCILEYGEYVRGYGSKEFSQLYQYPPIKEIRDALQPNNASIIAAQKAVMEIVRTHEAISRNPIVVDLITNNVKTEQLLQIILVRGFNTDIDSHIYKRPIMGNYFAGITDPAEVMMESTLAAKALLFQGAPLEQTEYANRRIQQSAAHVDFLIEGDCGSKSTSEIEVTPKRFGFMLGLYYEDPTSKTGFRPMLDEDTHLIGKTLKFRHALLCGYRDKQCVCSTCYGELAHSIPYGSNLGTVASTNSNSQVSQAVLKVKHSEDSTDIEDIVITEAERKFISLAGNGEHILFNSKLGKKGIQLVLNASAKGKELGASRIPILTLDDLEDRSNASKFTRFDKVTFLVPNEDKTKKPVGYHVTISRGTRKSYLTPEFLRYIITNDFRTQDDGKYYIDLANWDVSKPVFELPRQHLNMKDFAAEVVTFIQSSRAGESSRHLGQLPQLIHYINPTEALMDLADLINSKVKVHLSHISVVTLSMAVARDSDNDYHTPPLGVPIRFARYGDIMNNRSNGALFAYQGAGAQLNTNINQYLNRNRPQHLYDPILKT